MIRTAGICSCSVGAAAGCSKCCGMTDKAQAIIIESEQSQSSTPIHREQSPEGRDPAYWRSSGSR